MGAGSFQAWQSQFAQADLTIRSSKRTLCRRAQKERQTSARSVSIGQRQLDQVEVLEMGPVL